MGNGDSICIWLDPWIPNIPTFHPLPCFGNLAQHSTSLVSHFINFSTRSWNICLLQYTFDSNSINKIMQIKIHPSETEDRLLWTPDSKGLFTVRFAYRHISSPRVSSLPIGPSIDWKNL